MGSGVDEPVFRFFDDLAVVALFFGAVLSVLGIALGLRWGSAAALAFLGGMVKVLKYDGVLKSNELL